MLAGQCSEPIQVAAGVNEIVEHARANTELTDVDAFPWDRLLTVNLINRTATVEVPVSDSSNDETQVHFRNEALRGQLKVCKALGPGSADLIGQRSTSTSMLPRTTTIWAIWITAAGSTQCKIVGFVPIGSRGRRRGGVRRVRQSRHATTSRASTSTAAAPAATSTRRRPPVHDHDPAGRQHGDDHQHRQGPARGLQGADPLPRGRGRRQAPAVVAKQPTFTFKIDGGA